MSAPEFDPAEAVGELEPAELPYDNAPIVAMWAHNFAEVRLLERRRAPVPTSSWGVFRTLLIDGQQPLRRRLRVAWQIYRASRKWLAKPPRCFPLVALWEDFPDLAGPRIAAHVTGRCHCIFIALLGVDRTRAWLAVRATTEPADWCAPVCGRCLRTVLPPR
jgi:hypothetical protein